MNDIKTLKLIVTPSKNCFKILTYLNNNIYKINNLGIRVHVEKISSDEFDEDMVNALQNKGINRLPALICPGGEVFIGLKSISDVFEKNLKIANNRNRTAPVEERCDDVTDFWMNELYSKDGGKKVPRSDDEKEDEDGDDVMKRMADYRRNMPTHRRTQDDDTPDRENNPGRNQPTRNYEDNIADDDHDERRYQPTTRRAEPRYGSTGNAMDDVILAALMDNLPSSDI